MNRTDREQLILRLIAAFLAVALVLCLLWIFFHDCESSSGVQGHGDSSNQSTRDSFTIAGAIARPISPGVSAPLDLALTNTSDVAITISSITVTVREVAAPNADADHPCSVADFTVQQAVPGLDLTLSAGETGRLSTLQLPPASWPQVRMMDLPVNQDGCKQSTLTLDYSGAGKQDE